MFKGAITAIVTPFKNGKVDEQKLRDLVEFQIKNGINGLVPVGTTGESPTLDNDEHHEVIEICIDAAAGRVPVIAGTGSNSTAEAISLTKHAAKAGADGALIVSPYYNKPTQEGLYRHYKAISDSVDIPIIVYNIAGRTAVNIETPTLARIAHDCKNVVGVKEASGSLTQMQSVKQECPEDFLLLSGDDALTLPVLSIGGVGIISVAANLIPGDVVGLVNAFNVGNLKEARQRHFKMLPLFSALFLETNPIPIKEAMGLAGLCSPELRLPLCPMSDANRAKLKKAMEDYGVFNSVKKTTEKTDSARRGKPAAKSLSGKGK